MADTFTLDTSGEVRFPADYAMTGDPDVAFIDYRWSDLSPFAQGYVEALFADGVALDDGAQLARVPLGFSDLAGETLARILEDCEAALGDKLCDYTDAAVHGAMFWRDRQAGQLNGIDPLFPPLLVHLADDGLIYFREASDAR